MSEEITEIHAGLEGVVTVEHELVGATSITQLVRYQFDAPPHYQLNPRSRYRLELCIDPQHKSAGACFPTLWAPNRFEKLGSLFIIPPTFDVIIKSDEKTPIRSFIFELESDHVLRLFDRFPGITDWQIIAGLDLKTPRIWDLLWRAAAETRQPGFSAENLIDILAMELGIELVRLGNKLRQEYGHGGLVPWQLQAIDDRLQESGRPPNIRELAKICKISDRQLARAFHASRGCSIGSFVASRRLEHAKILLSRGFQIAEVAALVGFSTPSNFAFAFRRHMGLSPSYYQSSIFGKDTFLGSRVR